MNNKDLKRRIDIEQNFAKYVLKDFKQKRYGICSDACQKQLEKFQIKKELYDWKDLDLKKDYPYIDSEIEYYKETWISGDPCAPWMEDTCNNGCTVPAIFIPNSKQLNNNDCGEGPLGAGYNIGGGINTSRNMAFSPSVRFPLKSGEGQLTIYYTVNPVSFLNKWQDDPNYNPNNSPDPNGPVYRIPVAQFYLKPYPPGHPYAGEIGQWFKYKDPSRGHFIETQEDLYDENGYNPNEGYGSVGLQEYIDENGDVWYIDYNPVYFIDDAYATGENRKPFKFPAVLFGNTNKDFNTFKLNGGENTDDLLSVVYVDGGDIYDLVYTNMDEDGSYTLSANPPAGEANTFIATSLPSYTLGVTDPNDINWSNCTGYSNQSMGEAGVGNSPDQNLPMLQRTCSYDCAQGTTFYEPSFNWTLESGDDYITGVYSDQGNSTSNIPCVLSGFTILESETETMMQGPTLIYGGLEIPAIQITSLPGGQTFPSIGDVPASCAQDVMPYNEQCCCPEGYNLIQLTSASGLDIACEQIPASSSSCLSNQLNQSYNEDGFVLNAVGCIAAGQTCIAGDNGQQWVSSDPQITPYPEVSCIEDVETLHIEVVNQNGDPISGYEIIIDAGNFGFTDQFGKFTTVIKDASVNTKHTINVCHCFETVGWCAQKYIKLVVTDDEIVNNTINGVSCINISDSE